MAKDRIKSSLVILALLIIILIFFSKIAFSNLVIARGDTFLFFFPYWEAASMALKQGILPIWNDSLFMGAPFLANSQVGLFYPLNWPVWLFFETQQALNQLIHFSPVPDKGMTNVFRNLQESGVELSLR